MEGMDKCYNGHVWTKTLTTNINNNLGLAFRSSNCAGHLQCQNPYCKYLQQAHRTSSINDTEFEGFTKELFLVEGPPSIGSSLVCKIYKEPPIYKATCDAKIFYVHGSDSMKRAYIHLGHHRHPIKTDVYRYTCKKINALIEEHVKRTPQALLSKIIIETNRDLLGEYLLRTEDDLPRLLSLEELKLVFDCCKKLNSPNLKNKVTTFKYLKRFGVMDGITKLRGLSNWAFVQQNMFLSQGNDYNKIFIFNISKIGPGSGVDLATRMQLGGNPEHAWLMSDHIKRVNVWTTMACHIYDSTYQRVMTIAYCNFQSEDKDAQVIFWKNLNHVMARDGVLNLQFKGFMADSTQAN